MIQDFVMGKFYTFVVAELGETTHGTVPHRLQCTLFHAYKCLNSSLTSSQLHHKHKTNSDQVSQLDSV